MFSVRYLSALALLLALSAPLTVRCVAAETPVATEPAALVNTPLSLNGTWRFALAANEEAVGPLGGFFKADFDASAFKPIPVPADWTTAGFEDPAYVNGTMSEGFYLHTFEVPAEAKGLRALLRFAGVWQSAEVWVNGTRIGRHDSGFTGFAFDVTKALKPGETNRLAVRVRQRTQSFKMDTNDDWALPGIYRGVSLAFTPKELFIERVEVRTTFDRDYEDATLLTRVLITRDAKADFFAVSPPFRLRAVLRTTEGQEVQRTESTFTIVGSHNGRDVPLTMAVRKPAQWTAETPALYDLNVELLDGEKVVQRWADRIGFRDVTTAGGVLRVNGRAVKLRGVARHDQHPDVGRSLTKEHWLEEIRLLKAANINAVRAVHYPHAEEFIRLCDEYGFYVLEEVPMGFGGDNMHDPAYAEAAFLRIYETVARDRNRPSIIVWDLGNEDPLSGLHIDGARALKGLDPTRPILMPFRHEQELPPEIDILAPHYWKAEEYDRLASVARRPVISTEYSHALGPDDFGELPERYEALTRHASGAGAFIWMWADQGLRRKVNGRTVLDPLLDKKKITREGSELVRSKDAGPGEIYDSHGNNGTDGIIDADRKPQIDYWETKAAYAPAYVLESALPFTPGQPEVILTVRNRYDFLTLAGVKAEWTLFRAGAALANGTLTLSAAPKADERVAVPTAALTRDMTTGQAYLHIVFKDAQGQELSRQAVRLGTAAVPVPATKTAAPQLASTDASVAVTAGAARYVVDRASGQLSGVSIGGQVLVDGADLAVWRQPTFSEANVLDRRERLYPWATYLRGLPAEAKSVASAIEQGEAVVRATTVYRHDDRNVITVDYVYRVSAAGALRIEYTVKPVADVPWLLELGVALKAPAAPAATTWQGYGPTVSMPNRHGAALFGQWTLPWADSLAHDTKSGVEWVRFDFGAGRGLFVTGATSFRQEATGAGASLRLLSRVAGSWVKGGPAERPEWRLDLTDAVVFSGALELIPVAP